MGGGSAPPPHWQCLPPFESSSAPPPPLLCPSDALSEVHAPVAVGAVLLFVGEGILNLWMGGWVAHLLGWG